jgi:hypothetical protein
MHYRYHTILVHLNMFAPKMPIPLFAYIDIVVLSPMYLCLSRLVNVILICHNCVHPAYTCHSPSSPQTSSFRFSPFPNTLSTLSYRSLNEHFIHQTAPTPCLQLGHIITSPSSHHHEIFINIATQNVGGLKSESERGSGPKISTLRTLARERLDFFVLTETRVDVRAVKKIKLKRNLEATMHSLHPRPRGGGLSCSPKENIS